MLELEEYEVLHSEEHSLYFCPQLGWTFGAMIGRIMFVKSDKTFYWVILNKIMYGMYEDINYYA